MPDRRRREIEAAGGAMPPVLPGSSQGRLFRAQRREGLKRNRDAGHSSGPRAETPLQRQATCKTIEVVLGLISAADVAMIDMPNLPRYRDARRPKPKSCGGHAC
jgi:hypothetical protein